jgi:hypothetical protein
MGFAGAVQFFRSAWWALMRRELRPDIEKAVFSSCCDAVIGLERVA